MVISVFNLGLFVGLRGSSRLLQIPSIRRDSHIFFFFVVLQTTFSLFFVALCYLVSTHPAEMSMVALPRQFIFHYRRGAARQRQLPKKENFKNS